MRRVLTTVLFLCSALAVRAQESNSIQPTYPSSSTAATGNSSEASPNTPWLPIGINAEVGSLAFSSETGKTNLMSAGLGVSSGYDDNALSNNADKIGNVS